MRKHSVAKSKVTVLDALFPAVRQHILGTILAGPARWWFLSELAHHLVTTPSSLQRELPLLVNAGILEERRDGTRTYFRAQQASPTYRNLRGIFAKTQEDRKKSQSPVPKRRSALPLVSRELISRYNRKELYKRVWSQPIQKLAAAYGLSDVGLGKVCRKLKIPLPGRGYWTKRSAGKPVGTRPPLPFIAKVESSMETPRPLRKATPRCRAASGCTPSKPGAAMKVMVYPRPKIKAILVKASRKVGLSLSSFIIRSALKRTAAMMKCDVTDLIPADELAQYV
jgi:DNA-binding transcriptional ArsR family regulator